MGPVSHWLRYSHDELYNGIFIWCHEEWSVITVIGIFQLIMGEVSYLLCGLKQFQY
jgi:hypothetical protein